MDYAQGAVTLGHWTTHKVLSYSGTAQSSLTVDVSGTVDLRWTLEDHGLRLRRTEAMRFVAPRVVDSQWVK